MVCSENATGKREEKSERKEVREEEKVPEEKRTLRNVAPEDGKGGYCECCCVRFNDLSKVCSIEPADRCQLVKYIVAIYFVIEGFS